RQGRVSDPRLRGVRRDHRARPARELAGARAGGRDRVRDLPLHQVLPVVLGLDAGVSVLRSHRARRGAGDSGAAPPSPRSFGMMLRVLPALVIVVAANVATLAGVAANRSGEPDAVITMTERELPLRFTNDRNSARQLTVRIDRTGT